MCLSLCTWFGVFGPSFPKLPQHPSTCETGSIARPTEGPDTRVRSHLMWNKELKTLDYFSCVPAHDLGYLGPISPKFPQYPSTCETGIVQPMGPPDTRVRSNYLMWNKELKTLNYLCPCLSHDLGIRAQFPQIAPIPKYLWNRYI